MTATTEDRLTSNPVPAGPLLGLGNIFRKDILDWRRGRRAWTVAIVTSGVMLAAVAGSRLQAYLQTVVPAQPGDPVGPITLGPMENFLAGIGTQFFVFAAIFATASLLIAERDSGTLAWTISKPVGRGSVWISKWLSASIALWITAVVIPVIVSFVAAWGLYGMPDARAAVILAIGLGAVTSLYAAVTLTASTFVPNQAAVAAIGLAVMFVPDLLTGVLPTLRSVFPTSMLPWTLGLAMGQDVPWETPLAWAIGIAVLAFISVRRLEATEF